MSVCQSLKNYLISDDTASDPAVVAASNSECWSQACDVPAYAYQPLTQIFLGTTGTSIELEKSINFSFGEGRQNPRGEISLIIMPVESVRLPELPFNHNIPGAETAYLMVILRYPEGEGSIKRMEQTELRIRYLLDYQWRTKRKTGCYVPSIGESSIKNPIYCKFERYETELNANQVGFVYSLAYERCVPKT